MRPAPASRKDKQVPGWMPSVRRAMALATAVGCAASCHDAAQSPGVVVAPAAPAIATVVEPRVARTEVPAPSPCGATAHAPIARDAPAEKAAAERASLSVLTPELRACLSASTATRFSLAITFFQSGRVAEVRVNGSLSPEVECAARIVRDGLCISAFEGEWSTEWTFCAVGCAQSPYCHVCVD